MLWRGETEQEIQDNLNVLAAEGMAAAEQLLEINGEFFPFGLRLPASGEVELLDADPGLRERPPAGAVLHFLREVSSTTRDGSRAMAIVVADETQDGDATRLELEHREGGPALDVLLPYRRRAIRRSFEYGELVAEESERRVWPRSSGLRPD
jgi:hypothetical protein